MIILIGPRGAGKTAAGRRAAELLGRPFIDLDGAIAAESRRSAAEWLRESEPGFRAAELACLEKILTNGPGNLVLALGGGAPMRAELLLQNRYCIYLQAGAAALRDRLLRDPSPRPPLAGASAAAEIEQILAEREPTYRALAREIINTDAMSLDAAAAAIADAAKRSGA